MKINIVDIKLIVKRKLAGECPASFLFVIISNIYPTSYKTSAATKRRSAVSAPSGSRRGNRGTRHRGRVGWRRCRPAFLA